MPAIPSKIKLHKSTGELEVAFPGQGDFTLSSEYLRVMSPSAEVKGHGPGQEVLQFGKKHVRITGLEKNGNYAIRILFDDEHDTGIYSWNYLLELGQNQDAYWQAYLEKLNQSGKSRDPDEQVVKIFDL
jgi:DUF971 family protein